MKFLYIFCFLIFIDSSIAQHNIYNDILEEMPPDLPLPIIKIYQNPSEGFLFASVPYWGKGNNYIVIYNNDGDPVFFRSTKSTCTDFKLHENGLITYFDYSYKTYYALDSTMMVVDSFRVQNGYETDEHDIKFLENGNVLLIGLNYKLVDMSEYVEGGNTNASVVLNVIQEIDSDKNLVFEWKSDEHYKYTDASDRINLLDQAFVHSHINSIDVDEAGNLIISARNLNEISKIDRTTGEFIWRFGGRNNQFQFLNDSLGFSGQHSVSVLKNGNLLVYDNGLDNIPAHARAVEYKLDEISKTATAVWSYRNNPDIVSNFWGNVQRLPNGNTFISWGLNKTAATEIDTNNEKVYEVEFPQDVYSYRIFKFNFNTDRFVSVIPTGNKKLEFMLRQNYPNPFNPISNIKYQIAEIGHVNITVFNMIGEKVMMLVDQIQSAGNYQVQFDGTNLSSGIYIYRITMNKFTSVKKLMLIK